MQHTLLIRRPFKYEFKRATLAIIFINVVIFALRIISPEIYKYLYYFCCMCPGLVEQEHYYWQFFTYMYMHLDLTHLLCNMLGLLCFGLQLERAIGTKEFVLFYHLCGIIGGLFSFLIYRLTGQMNTFLLGASGAIYAVLFGFAVCFPRSVICIWGLIPVPAPVLVLLYAIIEVGSQLLGRDASVAHMTHLFGFIAAWLYFVVRMGVHPLKVWKNK